jgi:O-6-methylguanine DNA methyltransferase
MLDFVAVKTGGTPFQRMVWSALREIPAGAPTSYGELAKSIGRASAVRAVGLANGANPIGIVVPCHRVIGANGSLTGYGGGLERKQWLLAHEARHALAPSEQLSSTACDAAVTMPTASRCAFEAPRASASATTPAMSSPARSPRTPAA